jgi:hypothetical protein
MGYSTDFYGVVKVTPALNSEEIDYLNAFAESRRMVRLGGPYCTSDDAISMGSGYNTPPAGQPGLWCQWVPTPCGNYIEWDGNEKFYNADDWMKYLIEHFLMPGAKAELGFLQKNHTLNGKIEAQGEDPDDRWLLRVVNNTVTTHRGRVVYD